MKIVIIIIMGTDDLTKILEIFKDSKEHNISEIRKNIALPDEVIDAMFRLLQEQNFIQNSNGELTISTRGLKLLELPSELHSVC